MKDMIRYQIINRGIVNPHLIQAMEQVDRAYFVPQRERDSAYDDYPLPIGFGQTISQPYIVAYMIDQLNISKSDSVLEIGTGSGYQTAVLSKLAREVFSIETIPELALRARSTLNSRGYENIRIKEGDGFTGWPDHSPFNRIIVSAAAPIIPRPLLDQMEKGGKMILPVGREYSTQYLKLIEKTDNKYEERTLLAVRFVPFVSQYFH